MEGKGGLIMAASAPAQYVCAYASPIGKMLLAADDTGLVGAWFAEQKYFAAALTDGAIERETPLLAAAKNWLDRYFAGERPNLNLPLNPPGTPFQQAVWQILLAIPYGETMTYGAIARLIAARTGRRMSAQAVGQAVGHNHIAVLIPCHRVVGAGDKLTGYAGGIERKKFLLRRENVASFI